MTSGTACPLRDGDNLEPEEDTSSAQSQGREETANPGISPTEILKNPTNPRTDLNLNVIHEAEIGPADNPSTLSPCSVALKRLPVPEVTSRTPEVRNEIIFNLKVFVKIFLFFF